MHQILFSFTIHIFMLQIELILWQMSDVQFNFQLSDSGKIVQFCLNRFFNIGLLFKLSLMTRSSTCNLHKQSHSFFCCSHPTEFF